MASRTATCGNWAMCTSPARSLARLGRASLTSSSRRASRPCVLAARLRRCEPPPSRECLRGRMFIDVGCNCAPGSRVVAACPRFPATVLASTHPPAFFIDENRPSWTAAGHMFSSMKKWGPRCRNSARAASSSSSGGLRWAGGGSHRLAVPGRGSCLLVGVSTGSGVTLTRSRPISGARCWTQRRLAGDN